MLKFVTVYGYKTSGDFWSLTCAFVAQYQTIS